MRHTIKQLIGGGGGGWGGGSTKQNNIRTRENKMKKTHAHQTTLKNIHAKAQKIFLKK